MIGWIVTDLDGTLVGRDLLMVDRSRQALLRFAASGGRVVIATGRSERSARRYYDELGLSGAAILYNGARTVDLRADTVLDARCLPSAAWPAVVSGLPEGVFPVAFCNGEALVVDEVPELREYARRDGITLHAVSGWDVVPAAHVTKVMLIGAVEGWAPPAPEGTTLVRSEATYLEVLPEGATKGAALRALTEACGVPLNQVAAIGDNPNDLDMLAAAGLGVAVGDGHADVRAAADLIVGPCATGAVADLVDHLLGR
ncbi:HAD family hydrolase [Nonomuraea sp. NPDC050556]|uniref:HAD family hydrolase n=1 Tax=Nonomuraea sp. NPDC050556 TaxID=3364369 RepID=UPI0037B52013